jgi:hypothetical protein
LDVHGFADSESDREPGSELILTQNQAAQTTSAIRGMEMSSRRTQMANRKR